MARRNAANPEHQLDLKRTAAAAATQRKQDRIKVMESPVMRRVLWDIIDRTCNTHGGSYVDNSLRTAFNEGRRSVGLELRQELGHLFPELRALRAFDYVHMPDEQLAPEADDSPSEPEAD